MSEQNGVAATSPSSAQRPVTGEALNESGELFRAMANAMPTLAWMAHADGFLFWYNQRWYDFTGTKPEEMEGWGWRRVHDPAVLPLVLERWTESIATGLPFEMEFPLRGADGGFRPFLTRAAPVRDDSGNVTLWVGTNTDVSEQRAAIREREKLLVAEQEARVRADRATDKATRAEREVSAVIEAMSDAFVTLDRHWRITHMNPAAERVNGRPARDFIGRTHWEAWPTSVGSVFEREYRRARAEGVPVHFEARYSDPGILDVWTEIDAYPTPDGGLSIFFRDVTERRRSELALQEQATELEQQTEEAQSLAEELEQANAELQTAAHVLEQRAAAAARNSYRAEQLLAVSAALNDAVTPDEVADAIFREGMLAVGADAGSLALAHHCDDGTLEFHIVRTGGFAPALVESFRKFPLQSGRPVSDSVIARRPILIGTIAGSKYSDVGAMGCTAFIAVPVVRAGKPLAAISFGFAAVQQFDGEMVTFLDTLGQQCAQALERARLYEADARRLARASFLSEATQALAGSLDYEITLRSIAEAAVPRLGDWCAVDVVEDPTASEWPPKLNRLAVVNQDPARRELGLSLEQRFPTDWAQETGMPQVLRDGTPQFFPVITDEMIAMGARSAEHLAALRELKFASVIIVALQARGLTLGALTLVMSDSCRHYDTDDLVLAQSLAERAAVAVDNARLFRAAADAREAAERASAEAQAANHAKSTFLATMSHEIRTPINAVLGYTDLLKLGISGPLTDAQQQHLARIHESTQHLLGLIEEVLDLAKVEAGTLRMTVASNRAGDSVNAALGLVRAQSGERSVELAERCTGDCAAAYEGDEGRVRQILANLLGNALKFTRAGGTVSVSCAVVSGVTSVPTLASERSYIAFSVTDTGIGIAADQVERIFEPFTQAESAERSAYTREQGGAGLGLAISRQLARLMGGDITVATSVGTGSTFTLWLPAADS